MNYIREAEEVLKSYRALELSIGNIRRNLNHLEDLKGPKGLRAACYDVTGIKGSSKEDDLLDDLFKYSVYNECLKITIDKIQTIDDILEQITEMPDTEEFYQKLLRLFYIEKIPVNEILEELGYSHHKSLYKHKEKAIRQFAILYFGFPAVS